MLYGIRRSSACRAVRSFLPSLARQTSKRELSRRASGRLSEVAFVGSEARLSSLARSLSRFRVDVSRLEGEGSEDRSCASLPPGLTCAVRPVVLVPPSAAGGTERKTEPGLSACLMRRGAGEGALPHCPSPVSQSVYSREGKSKGGGRNLAS